MWIFQLILRLYSAQYIKVWTILNILLLALYFKHRLYLPLQIYCLRSYCMQYSTCVITTHSNTRTKTYILGLQCLSFLLYRLWNEWLLYHVRNLTCFGDTYRGYLENCVYVFLWAHVYFLKCRLSLRIWLWWGK